MNKMISLTDDGAFLASDNISAADFLNITMNAQLNLFNNLVAQGAPKEELYDMANQAASAFLETFAPEIELRPDLTAEAILKAENEILTTQADVIPFPTKAEELIPLDSLDEQGKPKKPIHK